MARFTEPLPLVVDFLRLVVRLVVVRLRGALEVVLRVVRFLNVRLVFFVVAMIFWFLVILCFCVEGWAGFGGKVSMAIDGYVAIGLAELLDELL